MPAVEMAEAIKTQEISSEELTEILIDQISKINPIINAYCTPTFDLAREQAKRADNRVKSGEKLPMLNGVPVSIKDLMMTKGIRTTYGSKIYENNVPDHDEVVVKRLYDAGSVLLGKTNTPAFGFQPVTDNLIFGKTKNPWNLEKTSGGSSGGAAASVVCGMGPLALGSDGGGSIRLPSSLCGAFGLKPSFGRIPRYPMHDSTWITLDHYGPITRYVKDAALMLDAMAGPHDGDRLSIPNHCISYLEAIKDAPKSLKIGYSTDLRFIKAVDPEVEDLVIQNAKKLEDFGWEVEKAKIRVRKPELMFNTIVTAGFAYDINLNKHEDEVEEDLKKMIQAGQTYSATDLKRAEAQREQLYDVIFQYFKKYDLLITPTTACPAFDLGLMYPPKINGRGVSPVGWMSFTFPFNLTGNPAASIPCDWTSNGLPIGMQIIGPRFRDDLVLQVSNAFERIHPWQEKTPQLI